jgi:hypothetical protein
MNWRANHMPKFNALTTVWPATTMISVGKIEAGSRDSQQMGNPPHKEERSTTIVVLRLKGLLSNLVGMEGSDAKPMTIWIVEDNDDYRQVLADGLRLEIGCGVRTFSSTEEALRERQRATGRGAHYPPGHQLRRDERHRRTPAL